MTQLVSSGDTPKGDGPAGAQVPLADPTTAGRHKEGVFEEGVRCEGCDGVGKRWIPAGWMVESMVNRMDGRINVA